MALSALRRGSGDGHGDQDAQLAIGASDGLVINCPVCSRPIVADARRCPGCRTRLLMGVPARRASVFLALGALSGLLVAGLVIGSAAVALQALGTSPAASVAPGGAHASTAPGGGPVIRDPSVPTTSIAALRQALAINDRLATRVDPLRASLVARPFDSFAVASVLRSLAADGAVGSDAATRLQPWAAADAAREALAALYDDIRATARAGLANGFANDAAYRAAANDMLGVLARVAAADETARALAASVGIGLQTQVP